MSLLSLNQPIANPPTTLGMSIEMRINIPCCQSRKIAGRDKYRNHQRAGGGYTNNPVDVTSIKTLKQIFLSQDEPNF
jgi:hypothetical protein